MWIAPRARRWLARLGLLVATAVIGYAGLQARGGWDTLRTRARQSECLESALSALASALPSPGTLVFPKFDQRAAPGAMDHHDMTPVDDVLGATWRNSALAGSPHSGRIVSAPVCLAAAPVPGSSGRRWRVVVGETVGLTLVEYDLGPRWLPHPTSRVLACSPIDVVGWRTAFRQGDALLIDARTAKTVTRFQLRHNADPPTLIEVGPATLPPGPRPLDPTAP